jgi:3-deoxy-D-manno-octulosonic-acid transferase
MLLFYNLFSAIAVLLYLPVLVMKKGPEDRIRFIRERLGASQYSKTDIWVHAVSVGEVIACVPFLKMLKKEFPGKGIVLSTTTYTGQKVARERFPEAGRIMYMPCDTWSCINPAVKRLRPEIFITIETELWPALFSALKKNGSRVIILNGRISNKSFKGYRRFRFFMKKLLSYVDFFYMQGSADAEKIQAIGAEKNRVGIMGNFKYDISFDTAGTLDWLANINGRILLAASTHKGEEDIILEAYESVRQTCPDLKLILAPRHPERFNEVVELLKKRNLKFIRRSKINKLSAVSVKQSAEAIQPAVPLHGDIDIILLDTIGELSRVFSSAAVAFVGGSLVPVGGHNILEPAYWAKPIIFGPYMDNFPMAKEFLDQSAAVKVNDAREMITAVNDMLNNSEKAGRMGMKAKAIVENNAGSVKKAIELVRGILGTA